jgi:hypothetical protein
MRSDHETITLGNAEWAELVEADRKQTARIRDLEETLKAAIDTFVDMKIAFQMTGHPLAAKACQVAKDGCYTVLTGTNHQDAPSHL